MTLEVGREVDRYVVDRLLGEGGMAAVYRVKHGRLGTWHALKVLTHTSKAVRERLILEGKVQASLRHPNVVAVSDVLEIDNQPALLMEYVDGPSLERLFGSYRPSPSEALAVFRGILDGVRHAHARGLLHRDLKPANVLLQTAEGQLVPKVADFGLAKIVSSENTKTTRTGTTMGTPAYMAPEQIRNAAGVDVRADVFSLGCLLYELVTGGERAFVEEDLISLYEATTQRRYAPVRRFAPTVDARVEAAIAAALEPDLSLRVPSADALWELLYAPGAPGADARIDLEGPLATTTRELAQLARSGTGGADSPTWASHIAEGLPKDSLAPGPLATPLPVSSVVPSQEVMALQRRNRVVIAIAGVVIALCLVAVGVAGAIALYALQGNAVAEVPAPPIAAVPTPEAAPPATPTPVEAPVAATPAPPIDVAPAKALAKPKPAVASVAPAPIPTPVATAPTPVPPTPTPVVKPPPEPDTPGPAAATLARVRVEGDAKSVKLVRDGAAVAVPSKAVPPGDYEMVAVFDTDEVKVGRVNLVAGDDVTLRCAAQLAKCVARR